MGSSSPLATLLRRIGGGLPQMAPTFDCGGGGALDDDDVEDDDHWWGVEGWRWRAVVDRRQGRSNGRGDGG